MKKLILYNDGVPMEVVSKILTHWGEFANLVDLKTQLAKGCSLEWHVRIKKSGEEIRGYCLVRMVFLAYSQHPAIDMNEGAGDTYLPITEVDDINIFPDGMIWWNNLGVAGTDHSKISFAKGIAEALGKGMYGDFHYSANGMPVLNC